MLQFSTKPDIKVKEQSEENLLKGKKIYEPARFMTINQALGQLFEVEHDCNQNVVPNDLIVIGVARLGSDDQIIGAGRMCEVAEHGFGSPLHCLVIPGIMHEMEYQLLQDKYCLGDKKLFHSSYKKYHLHLLH